MSVHPGNEVLMRMSAVERIVYGDASLDEVAREIGVPVDDLQEWVQQEVAELESRLCTARRALTRRVGGEHDNRDATDTSAAPSERPWVVEDRPASDPDAEAPRLPDASSTADHTLRRQVSAALNAADTVLCVTSGEQIEAALHEARRAGRVRGVVLILEPGAAQVDTARGRAHAGDDTAEVEHPGASGTVDADETHDAEESDTAAKDDSDAAVLQAVGGNRRMGPFPRPQPRPIDRSSDARVARPEDPTELQVYRPEVEDQRDPAEQSDEYSVVGADETDPPGHDKVFRLDLGEHGDYDALNPAERSDAGERSDATELPGVEVDATLVLKYRCEHCGRKLKSKGSTLGQKVRCKGCDVKIVAPRSWTDPRVYYSSRDSDPNSDSGGGSTV